MAAFTIVPRHVLAASGQTAPSDKLNIASIGVGGMGIGTAPGAIVNSLVWLQLVAVPCLSSPRYRTLV